MSRRKYPFSYDHWSQVSWAQPVFNWKNTLGLRTREIWPKKLATESLQTKNNTLKPLKTASGQPLHLSKERRYFAYLSNPASLRAVFVILLLSGLFIYHYWNRDIFSHFALQHLRILIFPEISLICSLSTETFLFFEKKKYVFLFFAVWSSLTQNMGFRIISYSHFFSISMQR